MSRKILLVDKKSVLMRLIQRHLESAGYELIQARNETEAASAIAREKPNVMVIDQPAPFRPAPRLPGDNSPASELPVIRLTDVRTIETPDARGHEIVLTKPYSPTQLMAEIKRLSSISTEA